MGCARHRILAVAFGSFVVLFEDFEHVLSITMVNALHKGCFSHTFPASAHALAKIHSPEVLSSICSQGLGLEHGRTAQRSLSLQKEMSCVLQLLSVLLLSLVPALQNSWHDVPLQSLQSHKVISRTSPTPAKEPTIHFPFLSPRSQYLRHGTSHRCSRCLNQAYPDQSCQSSPPAICVRVLIDERRYHLVHIL